MRGRWDAKSNPRDYGIARNFGSGLRDRKTLLGTLHVKFWMNKCTTFTPLGFCFLCIFIVTVFSYHRASVFNLKIQRIIQCQTKCHSHLTLEFYDTCIKRSTFIKWSLGHYPRVTLKYRFDCITTKIK